MAKSPIKAQLFMQNAASFDNMGGPSQLAQLGREEFKDNDSDIAQLHQRVIASGNRITPADEVNIENASGQTPYDWAVYLELLDIARNIVAAGGNANHINPHTGRTYLMDLTLRPHATQKQINTAIASGSNVKAEDQHGHTAMEWSIFGQNHMALTSILEANADINRVNPKQSGLTYTAQLVYRITELKMPQESQLKFALDHGADANTKIGDHSIFSFAFIKKAPQIMNMIAAAHGFDINTKIGGQTVFEFAMSTSNKDLAKAVASNPTFNPHAALDSGLKPHDWAKAEDMDDLVQTMDQFHPFDAQVGGADGYGAAAGGG